jgi:hypothetical protein
VLVVVVLLLPLVLAASDVIVLNQSVTQPDATIQITRACVAGGLCCLHSSTCKDGDKHRYSPHGLHACMNGLAAGRQLGVAQHSSTM